MTERVDQDDTRARAEQAADWRPALESTNPSQKAEYWAWVRQSDAQLSESMIEEIIDEELCHLSPEHRVGAEENAAAPSAFVGGANSAHVSSHRGRRTRVRIAWAIAASLMVLGTALIGWRFALYGQLQYPPVYMTKTGELRTLMLDDGSSVALDAESRVRVRFSKQSRDLDLEGQALFQVAHDSSRRSECTLATP